MTDKHLHIISFDVPFPANYGGVIDVFYKLKALSEKGVKIHLHCFEYGRKRDKMLAQLCESVQYYKRDMSLLKALNKLPYIVCTRHSDALIADLLKDDYPILCEGLHTTLIMEDPRLENRKIYVRTHNVEHDYYSFLAHAEKSVQKKLYYVQEASKLYRYEPVLNKAAGIFAITEKDAAYFKQFYHDVTLLPAFNSFDTVKSKEGCGKYVLYHGKLSVAENFYAAEWLILNVFHHVSYPCVIAGLEPPERLRRMADRYANITLIANPSEADMQRLLRDAQVNVLVTNQATGLKLKLLNALYNGRHCLVNEKMLQGTSLSDLCSVAEQPTAFVDEINRLMTVSFSAKDIELRSNRLNCLYCNGENAQKLIDTVFE